MTRLVRNEVSLAQYEVRAKLERSGPGVRLLSIGLVLALLGAGAIVACLVLVLVLLGLQPWLSALIVGVVVLIIGLIFISAGRGRLRKAGPPVPTEALASIQEDVKLLAEGVRR